MSRPIMWVHEKALHHDTADGDARAIFIWDDAYFKQRGYSLKRLVFIYETLCEMDIDIIKGDTIDVLQSLAPEHITMVASVDSQINQLAEKIAAFYPLHVIEPVPFVHIGDGYHFTRFFKYWNKAKKTAFLTDGGSNA